MDLIGATGGDGHSLLKLESPHRERNGIHRTFLPNPFFQEPVEVCSERV